jgi:hypothetical protein
MPCGLGGRFNLPCRKHVATRPAVNATSVQAPRSLLAVSLYRESKGIESRTPCPPFPARCPQARLQALVRGPGLSGRKVGKHPRLQPRSVLCRDLVLLRHPPHRHTATCF